ncbi:hypothetical protein [Herbinix luporum]|jgi:hypothetical protein|uniref:hypothetical protein n=1 Tax=Herbinix luporum TaxID=1679721 RepID=UPI001764FF38|nr:hypothetical protein [Herbinix luporum]HHT56293.1 hypothetical protein [Herbinix luporum]
MKKRTISILFIVFVVCITLVACGKKELPFTHFPENDIIIDYMEEIIQNQEKYEGLYYDYASMRIAGVKSDELEQFITGLTEEALGQFTDNADKHIALKMSLDEYKEEIDEGAKTLVDNYLKYSRLGDKEAREFGLSKELEAQDPIGKVNQYMKDKKIEITEIIFPETFEDVNYDLYPMKYTYRYIIKGTVGKQAFEKEVVQDFYIGVDWSEGMGNIKDIIEYVRDVSK